VRAEAMTATSSATGTPSLTQNPDIINKIDKQIQNFKDKIASQVSQLKLVEKRGIIGTLNEVSGTQLKILDTQGAIRIVEVDELTKFSSSSAKGSFGLSDITNGTTIGIIGNYYKDSKKILARFVDVLSLPTVLSGAISTIDRKNYTIDLETADQKTFSIDIENITKTYVYTKDEGLKKSGFSKLQPGERVIVIGFADVKNSSHIITSRIIHFPEFKINPKINIQPTLTPTETPTPTSTR